MLSAGEIRDSKAVDIQWSDVRAERGLAHRLAATGRMTRLVDGRRHHDARARGHPGLVSGALAERFPDEVVAASWDSVIVEVAGQRQLQRIPLMEPLKGTRDQVGDLVESSTSIGELLTRLSAPA